MVFAVGLYELFMTVIAPDGTGVFPTGGGGGPLLSPPPPPHDASVITANPMYQCFVITEPPYLHQRAELRAGCHAESGMRRGQQQGDSPRKTANGNKTTVNRVPGATEQRGSFRNPSPLGCIVYGAKLDDLQSARKRRQLEHHDLANAPSHERLADRR